MFTETGHRDTETQRELDQKKQMPLCLCASVARRSERRWRWLVATAFVLWLSPVSAQQLLDRVVARVEGRAITLTDVQAALGLGAIQAPPGADPIAAGTQQMIDRQLVLAEVLRFPPPEPDAAATTREVARLKMNAGARLPALMESTGLTEERIREFARDDLRILAYLDQRFGATVQVSDEEVARYYRDHEAEFTRGGDLMPFEEADPVARQRASSERRRVTIDQWLRDLRARADISINPPVRTP
jgi:hypothetical protein